jgi:hypothetical protein
MGENVFLGAAAVTPIACGLALATLYRRVRRKSSPATLSQILVGNLLLLLFLVSSALLVGEVYYRFFYDTTDSLMYTKVSRRWEQRYYRWNTATARDNQEYKLFVSNGKRRITFLGDSFTAGHGIKNVEDRFANRIRSQRPEWEVHVLARPGFDTWGEIEFLRTWVTNRYELDLVALVYCLNDNSDMIPERWEAIDRIQADVRNAGWLRQNSFFLDVVYHRLRLRNDPFMRGYFDLVQNAYRGPLWQQQQQRLVQLKQLVESNGGKLVVITFPFLHALGATYPYEFVHQQFRQFWSDQGVPHLDLLPTFRNLSPKDVTVNSFDAHPNERANELVTPLILEFLQTNLPSREAVSNSRIPASPEPRPSTEKH